MCGVIGLIYERHRDDLGAVAGVLLRTLEYRGYDSSGAAIQGAAEDVDLRKDVGAPSAIVTRLGIDQLGGSILCGQVRWATFGAVDRANAQPHVVRCKTFIYGAHNGNVTNCDELKLWLESEGHRVASDNDGEMVVHTAEHFFARELADLPETVRRDPASRRRAMQKALSLASARLKGSYAAVIVDPVSRTVWAVKKGSSLYFGVGESTAGGKFGIVSSDLSSVLKLTRSVIPMAEGELAEFVDSDYRLFRLADGAPIERKPVRSRLRAEDTELKAPFTTFMAQEIYAQVETSRDVVRLFGRTTAPLALSAEERALLAAATDEIRDTHSDDDTRAAIHRALKNPILGAVAERAAPFELASFEKSLFAETLPLARSPRESALIRSMDAAVAMEELEAHKKTIDNFAGKVLAAAERGNRVFIVCCGSSFHAAKTATLFFNEIAGVEVLPLLPGELRGQYGKSLRDGDVIIAVSQSGETKDLIDAINMVIAGGKKIDRIALVNNINSTLAQEKSDLVVPLRCGPEIAVAATKSFINQLTLLYCLAVDVGTRRVSHAALAEKRRDALEEIPRLIARTLEQTRSGVLEAAKMLYLAPSMHILATRFLGVAKEGALKIREVVLNHTEGFEASEFKHGPNTILGFNTIYGLGQIEKLLDRAGQLAAEAVRAATAAGSSAEAIATELEALRHRVLRGEVIESAMRVDYPLLYVTGPDARDIDLTISQINTHKIRGSSTVIVAEESAALRQAAEKAPADNADYRSAYVVLPAAGDLMLTAFSATVVLQTLALEMSLLKQAHLDSLGVQNHGVHPDVPKNVSKSITVD